MLAELEKTRGRIDILVNNAGSDPGIRLAEMTMVDVRRTFEVNFFAAVAGTLAVLPGMVDRGEGIVVNVSSDGGRLPSPGPGVYPASKAALSAFTESVSFRVGRRGVRMHVVYPAWMPTAMGRAAIGRGLRAPPRLTRKTEEEVSRLVLDRIGGRRVELSAVASHRRRHRLPGLPAQDLPLLPADLVRYRPVGRRCGQEPSPSPGRGRSDRRGNSRRAPKRPSRPTSMPTSAPRRSWRSPLLLP